MAGGRASLVEVEVEGLDLAEIERRLERGISS